MSYLPDDATIRDALREIEDPEAGMDIVELGLIYAIDVQDERVTVDMTMTSPACPVADMLVSQATAAVQRLCPPQPSLLANLIPTDRGTLIAGGRGRNKNKTHGCLK